VLYLFLMLVTMVAWRELRPAASERRRRATLEVLDPARTTLSAGEQIALYDGVSLGRDAASDVRLDEDSVSARHALVRFESGRWWVEDLGSTNGTFINEARVTGRAPLRDGDALQVGRVTGRFRTRR